MTAMGSRDSGILGPLGQGLGQFSMKGWGHGVLGTLCTVEHCLHTSGRPCLHVDVDPAKPEVLLRHRGHCWQLGQPELLAVVKPEDADTCLFWGRGNHLRSESVLKLFHEGESPGCNRNEDSRGSWREGWRSRAGVSKASLGMSQAC